MPVRLRPRLKAYNEGEVVGRWTLLRFLGGGGNADVWRAKRGRVTAALKLLHRTDPEGYARFRREVEICEKVDAEAVAILPVLDSHLPENPRGDRPWFAMPIADTAATALANTSLDEKVALVRDVALTLAHLLKSERINHRDVKPENFYVWKGRSVIGDFGLAKRPEDPTLTTKVVGPYHHLPDEAFHDENPDRELIDVYCLANSLWRLAVDAEYPPRGQIRATDSKSLSLLLPSEVYIARLAGLIESATSGTPSRRPGLSAIADQLTDWLNARSDVDEFQARFEADETQRLAILRWVVDYVRREPVFDLFFFTESDEPPEALPAVPGFTYDEAARRLVELIEEDLIIGDPDVFRGGVPLAINRIYPTRAGLQQLGELEALESQSVALLRALLTPVDLTLPATSDPTEIVGGITLTPPEAYLLIRVLVDAGRASYLPLQEGFGGSVTFMDLHATTLGQRWLYNRS